MQKEMLENYEIEQDQNIYYARYAFEDIVKQAFMEFFNKIDVDFKSNFRGYYFDNFLLGTIDDESNTYYVELKQNNHNPIIDKQGKKSIKVIYPPTYTLEQIKNEIYKIMISLSNKDTLLYKTKHSIDVTYIEIDKTNQETSVNINNEEKVEDNRTSKIIYNFRLIIGESYKNEENMYGIKYYAKNGGDTKIEYPLTALNNYMYKNHITKNNYMYYANLFKQIILTSSKKEHLAKSNLIENMLYNLPNHLFNEKPNNISFRNIINYMKNYPLQDYYTLDNQYKLFLSADIIDYSLLDGREIIKILENYYKKNFA